MTDSATPVRYSASQPCGRCGKRTRETWKYGTGEQGALCRYCRPLTPEERLLMAVYGCSTLPEMDRRITSDFARARLEMGRVQTSICVGDVLVSRTGRSWHVVARQVDIDGYVSACCCQSEGGVSLAVILPMHVYQYRVVCHRDGGNHGQGRL